ncbi:hypothetical protein NP233_g8290 [Leucocoprinus birnbaumii]|uniref:F-box domain-containing protein n=1 Tax=Leucocoprinus birnbaumii TaxID=56174 RepID=A0AAD5YS06_9AGAR|nr:hypothetical protein NP233_g8290 [Leucocoprinus birnbaumii]
MTDTGQSNRCSLCGQPGNAEPLSINHLLGPIPHDKNIYALRREIERLDDIIVRSSKDKAALQQRLNCAGSPVHRLPAEILSQIFRHTVPLPSTLYRRTLARKSGGERRPSIPRYPQILSEVCSTWHRVVISLPNLWNTMIIATTGDEEKRCAKALDMFLQRSGSTPFHLEITVILEKFPNYPYKRPLKSIERIIFKSQLASRFETLSFVSPPWAWLDNIRLTKRRFSLLKNFWWDISEFPVDERHIREWEQPPYSSFINVPALRSLTLRNSETVISDLPTTITSLNLGCLSADTVREILLQCPLIAEFHCTFGCPWYSWDDWADYSWTPADRELGGDLACLEHLRLFCVHGVDVSICSSFLGHLRLPAVESVTIGFEYTFVRVEDSAEQHLLAFFSRLPTTLTHLQLTMPINMNARRLHKMLLPLSNLKSLLFATSCSFLDNIVQILRPAHSLNSGNPLLPTLRRLEFHDISPLRANTDWNQWLNRLEGPLVAMFEERMNILSTNLEFIVQGRDISFSWSPAVQERITRLASSGRLDISGADRPRHFKFVDHDPWIGATSAEQSGPDSDFSDEEDGSDFLDEENYSDEGGSDFSDKEIDGVDSPSTSQMTTPE